MKTPGSIIIKIKGKEAASFDTDDVNKVVDFMNNKVETIPAKKSIYVETKISDLLDLIHLVIIKNKGVNDVMLDELKSIEKKIEDGTLPNYIVSDHPFYQTPINRAIQNFLDEKGLKLKST